jgi:tetratricopeptide (TPR) repeat protein
VTGDDWLELYGSDPGVAHLDRAIEWYEAEVAARPDDAPECWPGLGWARQERAKFTGDLADVDRAIELHGLVADVLPSGDEDRNDTLLMLAEAHYRRFQLVEGSDVDATASLIATVAAEILDERPAAAARVLQGLILAEGSDRVAVIAVLAPALNQLDLSAPCFEAGSTELCWAYVGIDDIDRAIEAGRRAGESENPRLNYGLAIPLGYRWFLHGDVTDRDDAIEYYRRLVAVVDDPDLLVDLGWLLFDRAMTDEHSGSADDAIAVLERAAAAGEQCAAYLAFARYHRWQTGHDRADLDRALEWIGRSLSEQADPALSPSMHGMRLAMARELIELEEAADQTRMPPTIRAIGSWLRDAAEVFADEAVDLGDRADLAAELALGGMYAWQGDRHRVNTTRLRDLIAVARTRPGPDSKWISAMDYLSNFADGLDELSSGGQKPSAALAAMFSQLRRAPELREALTELTLRFHSALAYRSGDRASFRLAQEREGASAAAEDRLGREAMDLVDVAKRGQPVDPAVVQDLRRRVDATPLSWIGRQAIIPFVAMIESLITAGADGAYRPLDRTTPRDLGEADQALQLSFGPITAAITRHDVPTLREGADRLEELLTFFPPGHVLRLIATGSACLLGQALLGDEPEDQDAARRLLRWSEEGIGITGGPHHQRYPAFALARANALRHVDGGDRAESRRWALEALRGFAWQVLLQAGTDDAVVVAATAGPVLQQVAGWCLADESVDDLVAVLDTGRGLVLQAATAGRTIADRLAAADHHELAGRWRSSNGRGADAITGNPVTGAGFEVPDELRATVLHTLSEAALTAVTTAEIRTALAAAGVDALIYLLPSGVERPGAAVVIPASGEPTTLTLPGLIATPGSVFDRLTDAVREDADRSGRDAEAAEHTGEPHDAVDQLGRWAHRAAMGAIRRHTAAWELGRAARLVLVPTGPLSAVPWHAARDEAGRFALEDVVISYAISGSAFAESSRRPVRDVKSALIVGDPTGELPFAGLEARAIAEVFYPDQAALGVDGTPRAVLDWIAAAAPGPSLLHLACHGYADPAHPADAGLRLAGGDLTARRLLEASRSAELEIEQVFLAACTTGAGAADHDEAFSLATAFLAAGARTVIGSLWKVPDAATSLLMFLVHHYRNVAGHPPADALRQAQLWMLDPARQAPAGMPPALAGHAADAAVADPRSWAAFVHRGR